MSKNITINGENYSGVSKIRAQVQGSATEYAEFIDADEIETGGDAVLTTKTITANGTYSASADNADGFSAVTVSVPTGGGEVANFPFPHNNIQTGSFTPTENEETHTIELPFAPKGFLCILDDYNTAAGNYAGVSWFYIANDAGGYFNVHRYNGGSAAALTSGKPTTTNVTGNTVTLDANVVQANYYFYAGRTYRWVAWDY